MAQTRPQVTLFVDFYVRPGRIEKWKEVHRPVLDKCANKPECLLFDAFEDPDDIGHLWLVEVWDATRQWFETVQINRTYNATSWDASKPTWRKDMEIKYLERLGEVYSYKKGYLSDAKRMD